MILNERKNCQKGLTRPSLAVMLCYVNNEMKEALARANIAEDPYLLAEAKKIFPASLVNQCPDEIQQHPLITAIVATQVSNNLFNVMAHRIMSSSGCSFLALSKASIAARDIFGLLV